MTTGDPHGGSTVTPRDGSPDPGAGRSTEQDHRRNPDRNDPDGEEAGRGGGESPTDLKKPTWKFVAKKTLREFFDDQCTDLAAALTYYAVLALFPALLALVSLLGLVGQAQSTTNALLGVIESFAPASAVQTLRPVVESLTQSQSAGFALVLGLATALWSASGYVGAFSRAMNRIYEIREGRPFWKMRPMQILVTIISVLLIGIVALSLVVSGPIAQSIGDAIGLGETAVTVWNIVKWPVMVVVIVLIIAILYYATPNVKQPKFQWISPGAIVAVVVWALASLIFAFYVGNFGNYNKTYGALAGVIIFLLWLWISNLALLFGAELNAEMERGRQLQAGLPAEEEIQLPPRDDRKIEKSEAKEAKELEEARQIRKTGGDEPS